LGFAVAGHVVSDSQAIRSIGRRNLESMRMRARGQALSWLDEWERLLDAPVEDLLAALTSRSPRSRDLRQNSPFAGVLSAEERERVLASWATHESQRGRS
jgi:hypothetical protein